MPFGGTSNRIDTCPLVVPFKPTLSGDACRLLACDPADTAREAPATVFGMLLYFWGLGKRGLCRNLSLCCMLSMILHQIFTRLFNKLVERMRRPEAGGGWAEDRRVFVH